MSVGPKAPSAVAEQPVTAKLVLERAKKFTHDNHEPAYIAIGEWINFLVEQRLLVPGDKLPAERQLASALGVSRMTLRQALGALENHGLVIRVVGAKGGTFIAVPRPSVELTSLDGLSSRLLQAVHPMPAHIISAATVAARPSVAEALQLRPDAPVYQVVRLRRAEGGPVAIERSSFPAVLLPGFLTLDLTGSLYDLLDEHYGRRPMTAEEELVPIMPERDDARLLEIDSRRPALRIRRTAFADDATPIEYSEDLFRGDRLRLTVSRRA